MTRARTAVRLGVLPLGAALGIAAEWAALHRPSYAVAATAHEQRVAFADLTVGLALVAGGALCLARRSERGTAWLLVAAGYAWFLGTPTTSGYDVLADIGAVFVTLHRGPLVHALLAYPTGRLRGRFERLVVVGGYASTAVAALGGTAWAGLALAATLSVTTALGYTRAVGPSRRARLPALVGSLAFGAVLTAASIVSIGSVGGTADRVMLWAYQAVVCGLAIGLAAALLRNPWADAMLTGLVVELGDVREKGILRRQLARALGDPSLAIGYWSPGQQVFLDEGGISLALADHGDSRRLIVSGERGEPVALLLHSEGVLDEPGLTDAVGAAVRLAVSNLGLQQEIARQIDEVAVSRKRILQAADQERRRLARAVREGPERRLERLAGVLAGAERDGAAPVLLAETLSELDAARTDLAELSRGLHPRLLTEAGLREALADLCRSAQRAIELDVAPGPVDPAIEAAAYFVCSEGLANVGKHTPGAQVRISVTRDDDRLTVVVSDDGAGGARLDRGSGLRGLADRVEALGGQFRVESPPGEGTTLAAMLPISSRADALPRMRGVDDA